MGAAPVGKGAGRKKRKPKKKKKNRVWRDAFVPRPAAAGFTPLTASWTRATARCRGAGGILCLLPCPLCDYWVKLQSYNLKSGPATLFPVYFIWFLTVVQSQFTCAKELKMDESAALHFFFFFPNTLDFLQSKVEPLFGWYITQQIRASSLCLCPRLCPLIPICYAPSVTVRHLEGRRRICLSASLNLFIQPPSIHQPSCQGYGWTTRFYDMNGYAYDHFLFFLYALLYLLCGNLQHDALFMDVSNSRYTMILSAKTNKTNIITDRRATQQKLEKAQTKPEAVFILHIILNEGLRTPDV